MSEDISSSSLIMTLLLFMLTLDTVGVIVIGGDDDPSLAFDEPSSSVGIPLLLFATILFFSK